jgi:ABC-type multidrug transport system fused ATPase/permease subunit
VFYGRYLKRLSNKTQEALGDMNKVRKSTLCFEIKLLINGV